MKVNIAVCGRFHYHNYIKYIEQNQALHRFFYSHKLSTNSSSLSVSTEKLINVWIKEYLIRAHIKAFGYGKFDRLLPLYHDLWQFLSLSKWSNCDILHFMLHGTSRKLIEIAKSQGSLILGEPVNAHPEYAQAIMAEEYDRLGLKQELSLSKQYQRLVAEVATCDRLIAPSGFVKQSYVARGFNPDLIHVIPYGVDLSNFYPAATSQRTDSTFRVICVAQISARKGHIYLLEAWKQLKLTDSELILIGGLYDEMKSTLEKFSGLFTYIPSVPNVELRHYFNRADVFVLPSVEDGFAVVCTEAMACGLPVITTVNTGASEILDHGKDGFVVPIRSPDAIAQYLQLLYNDKNLRLSMSEAALQKSRSQLDWQQYGLKLCQHYQNLMPSI